MCVGWLGKDLVKVHCHTDKPPVDGDEREKPKPWPVCSDSVVVPVI